MVHDPLNIVVAGVGGQGNILASDLISRAACNEGYHVSVGETYGATQRGGSVMSHIRLSEKHSYGPLIPMGAAHVIVGFEPLETYRTLRDYCHESVRVVMNDRPVYPLDALQKKVDYPKVNQLISWMETLAFELKVLNATELAKKIGYPQTQNVVMVGALAALKWAPVPKETFLGIIEESFTDSKLTVNREAFDLGFQAFTYSS